jgi:microcystin-dependent protein
MVGEIVLWPTATPPDLSWLSCDGSSYAREDYPDLFAVIGTTYGSVDGTHFNLPDTRSRVPLGIGTGVGLSAYSVGDTGGEETHTLSSAEAPAHSHNDTGHTHAEGNAIPTPIAIGVGVPAASAIPAVGVTGLGFASISSSGGGSGHNNIQPYLALNYLIRALP